tara:strand:+ start:91534 stop:99069 length:7536 start_codon:yes stop_codon:yes gene_type:complete
MAKKKLKNYIFQKGIPKTGNNYPIAWNLLDKNVEYLKDEMLGYIKASSARDTAINLYPNLDSRITNNKEYIKDEVASWVSARVIQNVAPFAGYTKAANVIEDDVDAVITAVARDVRYNGNEQIRAQIETYFIDGTLQLANGGDPEIAYLTQARTIITDFIATGATYSSTQNATTQDLTGSNGESGGITEFTTKANQVIDTIDNGIIQTPALSSSPYVFENFTYDKSKCDRDYQFVLDAFLNDLRYNGNKSTRYISSKFWVGSTPQLDGDRQPEIQTQYWIRDFINNYIFTNVDASNQSPNASTIINANKEFIGDEVAAWFDATYPGVHSQTEIDKCERDSKFNIEAIAHDIQYGGNSEIVRTAKKYWEGAALTLYPNERTYAVAVNNKIEEIINGYILTNTPWTSLQSPSVTIQTMGSGEGSATAKVTSFIQILNAVTLNGVGQLPVEVHTTSHQDPITSVQFTDDNTSESLASNRISTLSFIISDVMENGLDNLPALERNEVSSIRAVDPAGKIKHEDILLVTNTTRNTVLYNFADPSMGCEVEYDRGLTGSSHTELVEDTDFPSFLEGADTISTIFFNVDTSTHENTDSIQAFIEATELRVRPFDFGTDAIERYRIAKPQSMIDADFEYGLQPTKWQAISTQRGYPSIYEVPGTDIDVESVTTDASTSTQGIGASLITVNTTGPHNLDVGAPISIIGFAGSGVEGTGRATGSFVVHTIPTNKQLTYYAKAKVGTSAGAVISTKFTQMRRAAFYTGADLGEPSFSVASNGSSGAVVTSIGAIQGETVLAFTGTPPPTGAPITGTGVATGTQVTAIQGTGGAIATPKISGDYASGTSQINVVDASGIVQNSVMDRGDGYATTIISVVGQTLVLSTPLNGALIGDQTVYPEVAGTNATPAGLEATFNVTWAGGNYTVTLINTGNDYVVGDAIVILGNMLSGTTPENDLIISVDEVDTAGEILAFTFTGVSFGGTGSLSGISGTVAGGTGTGGTFALTKDAGTYTIALEDKTYTGLTATYAGNIYTATTWDITVLNGAYTVHTVNTSGTGHIVNDKLEISGGSFGGSSANNIVITVTSVDGTGQITGHTIVGTAPDIIESYISPVWSTAGGGTLATFTITRTGTVYTAQVTTPGAGFAVSDTVVIDGALLGGASTTNDCTLTINTIGGSGDILTLTPTGTAVNTKDFTEVSSSGYIGTGAQFSVTNVVGATTYSSITATSLGEKYGIGQELIILGSSLGGTDGVHDLTLALTGPLGANDAVVDQQWTDSGAAQPGPETKNYTVNDLLLAGGVSLGGTAPTNDAYVTVTSVDANGSITGMSIAGTGTDANVDYVSPAWTTSGSGVDATFSVNRTGTTYSVSVTGTGSGFAATDTVTFAGDLLGGATTANDCTITVDSVSAGAIATISAAAGTSVNTQTFSPASISARVGTSATFDVDIAGGNYTVSLNQGGSNYWVGQEITLPGTILYGSSTANDLVITITAIDAVATGVITTFNSAGSANTGTGGISTVMSGQNRAMTGVGGTFSVTRSYSEDSSTTYTECQVTSPGSNYNVGDRLTISGASLGGTTPANDLEVLVQAVSSAGAVTANTHSGTAIVGTGVTVYSSITISDATTTSIPNGTTLTYTAIATMEVTFLTPHGLVPGAGFLVTIGSDDGSNNHILASGPGLVTEIPSPTKFRYQVRSPGTITDAQWSGFVYVRPDSFFVHRPFDGGVMLGTGGPQHGAQAIRQSKKYIRYQSGKGIMYTTGALFAPSYDILNVVADGKAVGSVITITTDEIDHGLQVGAIIKLIGITQQEYNDTYTITQIISERVFKTTAQSTLSILQPEFSDQPQVSLKNWNGATVRSGIFDDQNGIFWEYDGVNLALTQRTATRQLAGTIAVTPDSNTVNGTGTRFREQLKSGDRIVIRGMTHVVSNVSSNTEMYVTPDYRGVNPSSGVKSCLILDKKTKQSDWNLDKVDGTGPSGYDLDVSKMQMVGIQMSWYGAGFIDYMTRGGDGNFIFCHRMRNSNVNTEAYMRTGNQPVRYEVTNEGANGKLSADISAGETTIRLLDTSFFPPAGGTLYIDNEIITYTGINGNRLTGCTRATQLTNFTSGSIRSYSAGAAAEHFRNTGVVLISNTSSPIISHWGSSYITDGDFDEERGYLFSYSATALALSTIRQTVFLIRLAPSIANALTGDLGDRDLLNRAQLLLDGLEITSEPTSGAGNGSLVVQGVINPQNYPLDPSDIGWTGLTGTAQGGQPSFAQIAAGGSVNWNGGATQTTQTAATSAIITTDVTNNWWNMGSWYNNYSYWLKEDGPGNNNGFADRNIKVGDNVSGGNFPAGTVITELYEYSYYFLAYYSQNHGGIPMATTITFSMGGDLTNTNYLYMDPTQWESSNATSGTELQDTNFPAGTSVISVDPKARYGPVSTGTEYYKVTFSQTSTGTINAGANVTFLFGNPPYAQPGETIFSFVAQPGERATLSLNQIKELTNTTLGGRGAFPNGPDALAINVYRTAGSGDVAGTVTLRWSEAQA